MDVLKLSFLSKGIMANNEGYEIAFFSDGSVESSGQGGPSPMAWMIAANIHRMIQKKKEEEAAEASAAEASGSQEAPEAGVGSSQNYDDKTDDVNPGGNPDESDECEGDKTTDATSSTQNKGRKRKGKGKKQHGKKR